MSRGVQSTDDLLCASETLACVSYCTVCGDCLKTKEKTSYVDIQEYARDRYTTLVYRHSRCPFNGPCLKDAVMSIRGSCVDLPNRTRALTQQDDPTHGSPIRPLFKRCRADCQCSGVLYPRPLPSVLGELAGV
jgi:hypothetical protein